MPHFGIQDIGLYPLIVYCVGVAIVIVFEIVLLYQNKSSFDLTQEPKAVLKSGKVEVTTKSPVNVETKIPAKPVKQVTTSS
jgi:hypothetical protein